jgi:2-methylcitrate dehydratase PrpD
VSEQERAVAAFVADLTLDDVPAAVQEAATLLVADTLGVTVGGSTDPDVAQLAPDVAARYAGGASLVGTHHSTGVVHAALTNGIASSVLEMNAGHKYAAGHPVVHLLAALLAEAEANGGDDDGDLFLAAFVAGYEVCVRAGRGANPIADGYMPFGTWGTVGAGAALARYRGFDADATRRTLEIAAETAQHSRLEGIAAGANGVRNGPVGLSNVDGILAADMAGAGFGGIEGGVATHLSPTTANGFDADAFADRLGELWELSRGYYKLHAAGRLTHPPIDALAAMQADEPIDPGEVDEVVVETYEKAATWLANFEPANRFQAKTSLPFAVATRLIHRDSGKAAFEASAMTDEVLALAQRVRLVVDDEFEARVPAARSARVTVRLTDGRTRTEEVEHARGGPERPFSVEELRTKFDELVDPVLGHARGAALWSAARGLPETPPGELGRLTRGE